MPTDVRGHVEKDSFLDELYALFFLLQIRQDQALHRRRFWECLQPRGATREIHKHTPMIWYFLQDLIGNFDGLLIGSRLVEVLRKIMSLRRGLRTDGAHQEIFEGGGLFCWEGTFCGHIGRGVLMPIRGDIVRRVPSAARLDPVDQIAISRSPFPGQRRPLPEIIPPRGECPRQPPSKASLSHQMEKTPKLLHLPSLLRLA